MSEAGGSAPWLLVGRGARGAQNDAGPGVWWPRGEAESLLVSTAFGSPGKIPNDYLRIRAQVLGERSELKFKSKLKLNLKSRIKLESNGKRRERRGWFGKEPTI